MDKHKNKNRRYYLKKEVGKRRSNDDLFDIKTPFKNLLGDNASSHENIKVYAN